MYLSKLNLERRNPSVRQSLANCEDMHRTIMKAFPQAENKSGRSANGVLYRMHPDGNEINVYVLSDTKPDFESIEKNGFICVNTRNIDSLYSSFVQGTHFSFDCLLNPSKKIKNVNGNNSCRVPLTTQEQRLEWLSRKSEQSGFRMEWVREEATQRIYGRHTADNGGKMSFSAVRYRGILTITDSEKFGIAFKNGIGSEKAYGLGMILLRKAG